MIVWPTLGNCSRQESFDKRLSCFASGEILAEAADARMLSRANHAFACSKLAKNPDYTQDTFIRASCGMMSTRISVDHQVNLRRGLKVVAAFAAVGFIVPWLLVVFYAIAHKMGNHPSTTPLIYLCPSSIIALGLDNAPLIVGLLGWLLISISNAVVYTIPGITAGIVAGLCKSD